ncbi:diaminopimelate decarboxylase [Xenorhabdus nematophila]|uniref:diaminopimelate decarboxylase n=1 Tax=Xenorhabdus nematophila TaxID=628 RepID=UPI0005419EFF|nr:diaminopimelate decarboxylase [Xenorhabdus nematophila]CEE90418.1 diaminopimelate decarboxylase, PLP-binding [Xenorhabdus nematophila str. Anatoliense]CEF31065.1 diaminopimelate decarboxylase, PLP-binding [Xenorhabdus nematophila str. Websteri]AYA39259.1 diaminopimelate decarboxylase [Xenorhabdus nematophila]KHD28398.1 diaminopimelate decarboxylase [Xenorhabdus nematophila]MBA0017836.1 diaminopimelate decarboxylase [Xenorhabdus nematophila]
MTTSIFSGDSGKYFTPDNLLRLPAQYGTPLWLYDGDNIIKQIKKLKQFDVIRFAQKACSNTHILRLMREQGVKVDSVSLGEIERALYAGFQPGRDKSEIVFTADVIDEATLSRVIELDIPVNVGSIDMLDQIGTRQSGHPVWLRLNPGFGHGHSQKTNTGGENSKHGIWYQDLPLAIEKIHQYGLKLAGLHMHIGSGVDYQHLASVCNAMVEQVILCGEDIQAISAGGGLSIPYNTGEEAVDTEHYYSLWHEARQRIEQHLGHAVELEIEPGRFLVAESGILMAEVRAVKSMGSRNYVLVDAGFSDLMRPAMYGSYHHISVLPVEQSENGTSMQEAGSQETLLPETLVAGPLCESGDVFTQLEGGEVVPRMLPSVRVGDYLIFHDTGAYGASMSSNYNSRPLIPEVLFIEGEVHLIRRRQTIEELLLLESC